MGIKYTVIQKVGKDWITVKIADIKDKDRDFLLEQKFVYSKDKKTLVKSL
jgi:hypothetical protein